MAEFDFDAVVVGAGVVGLAAAMPWPGAACRRRCWSGRGDRPGRLVAQFRGDPRRALLSDGSLKARLCVEGRRLMYAFCDAHHVEYDKCGKLVVAEEPEQVPRLDAIWEQALANDVEGMSRLTKAEALAPGAAAAVRGRAAVGRERGAGEPRLHAGARRGDRGGRRARWSSRRRSRERPRWTEAGSRYAPAGADPTVLTCRCLVTAPGLSAQAVAGSIEGFPKATIPQAHFGKGMYFRLQGKAPFRHLVYPPPIPGALGTHYRRDLGGQAVFGPDLSYVDAPEYSVDPGASGAFYDYIRRFWPALPDGALSPDYAGIRPKLHGPGEPQPDFRIDGADAHGLPGLVTLFGIESPGLTSSLAIGEEVCARLEL
jgi:L-2-hydroxyglutarate oxidase LhgO